MTVTLTTKHEATRETDDDNESCCADNKACPVRDHTESLLDNLDSTSCKERTPKRSNMEDYDEMFYQKARTLVTYNEAPEYLKHNSFIRNGYRITLNTELCLESIFWWTNETINIWSHIFGLILFLALTVYDVMVLNVQASFSDKFVVGSVLICFQACMFLSAAYHVFSCRSAHDCELFLAFDLFGIALSLFAIYTSGIFCAFWCHDFWQSFYIITVSIIFVIAMILQIPHLNIDPNIKMTVFVGWAAYGVLPTIHWTFIMGGFNNPVVQLLLPRVLGMYIISGIAFFIYITKIPERFGSGKFDYLGHSHQWWHMFVVLALYYWHNTGMMYIDYRLNHTCANYMRLP